MTREGGREQPTPCGTVALAAVLVRNHWVRSTRHDGLGRGRGIGGNRVSSLGTWGSLGLGRTRGGRRRGRLLALR